MRRAASLPLAARLRGMILPNWGVEAFYADLGEATLLGTVPVAVPVSGNAEIDGFGASVVGTWPIYDKFSVFGKVGFIYWDLEISGTLGGFSGSVDDTGEDLTYGVGAHYSFNETFAIRVEWERFDAVGNSSTTGESDVDFLSAGIVLSF